MGQDEFFDFAKLSDKKFWKKISISSVSEIKIQPDKALRYTYNYKESGMKM